MSLFDLQRIGIERRALVMAKQVAEAGDVTYQTVLAHIRTMRPPCTSSLLQGASPERFAAIVVQTWRNHQREQGANQVFEA